MDLRFNPDTNPYADDLLRLARAPGSRYTPRERQAMAAVLAGRLYGLHYRGLDFFYPRYQHAFVAPQHRHVAILTWFDDGASHAPGLFEHPGHDAWLIVLAVGDYGVAEAFNGPWTASTPDAVVAAVARLRAGEFQADARSDMAIERRSDDDARREYLGGDSGADEPRERPTRHDRHIGEGGGGGGDGRGGGGGTGGGETGGGARPGGGGAAEVVNHPVLFSVDAMTFDAILALT